MTEYVLSPTGKELERSELNELLLERFNHDAEGSVHHLKTIGSILNSDKFSDDVNSGLKASIEPLAAHSYFTLRFIRYFKEEVGAEGFMINDLLNNIKRYVKVRWNSAREVNIEEESINIENHPSPIYALIWNFVSNGFASYGKMSKDKLDINLEQLSLSSAELEHLGVNQNHYTTDSPFVRVAVKDLGPGIEPDYLPKIFNKGETTKGVGHGSGLALAEPTCRLIHGFVKVESGVGEGSTFNLYLPQRIVEK